MGYLDGWSKATANDKYKMAEERYCVGWDMLWERHEDVSDTLSEMDEWSKIVLGYNLHKGVVRHGRTLFGSFVFDTEMHALMFKMRWIA